MTGIYNRAMSRSYDDTLNAVIREAQIIADQILELQPFLPEAAVELPALVSELYAIVTCLRCLQLDTNHPPNLQDVIFYSDVIRDTLQAISRTLKDLDYYLSNKDRLTGRSRRESPRLIWEDLNEFFIRQSGNTLHDRLRHFKRFLREFSTILAG